MRVIIIGAGIGGLSAGIALKRLGHEVRIFDQVTEHRPVATALSLWSNGVKVLNWLGLGDAIGAMGGRMERMAYYDGRTGETMTQFSLGAVARKTGQRPYPVSRADLQQLLREAFGADDIRFGMRMTGIVDDGMKVDVVFAGGEIETADVLIAADGARSMARDYVMGRRVERSYSGYTSFTGLVAADERIGPLDQWTAYVAEGKRVAVTPVSGGRFSFVIDIPQPAGMRYQRSDGTGPLRQAFAGWAPGVHHLIDAIDPDTSLDRVEIWDVDPLQTWAQGRVAILGDAAHNTAPDIGQGACSALEDAFVLGIMFASNTVSVDDTLKRYERARVERAGELVLRARKRSHQTHALDPALTEAWYAGLRGESGENILRGIVGNIAGSPINLGADIL